MSDVPQVVLHLGAHKTGSSLIQKFLRDRPREAERLHLGVVSRSEGNVLFGWGDRTRDQTETTRRRIDEALAVPGVEQVVISHENALGRPLDPSGADLYPSSKECADALAEVCSPWSTSVIFYLRPQHEFLESYYLQTVHQGGTATFAEWIEAIDLDRVSWRPVVENLRAAFGAAATHIGDFGEIRAGQESFLTRFLYRVNPHLKPKVDYPTRRNASVGDLGLEIGLALNPYLETAEERRAARKFLQARFSNEQYPRPVLFTADEQRQLRERYGHEYAELTGVRADA